MIPQWGKGTSVAPGTSWLFRDLDFPTYTPANTGKPEVDTKRICKLREGFTGKQFGNGFACPTKCNHNLPSRGADLFSSLPFPSRLVITLRITFAAIPACLTQALSSHLPDCHFMFRLLIVDESRVPYVYYRGRSGPHALLCS